jgi:hypothetical protein
MGTSNETIRPDKRMVSATNFYDLQVERRGVLPLYLKLQYKVATIGEFKRGKIPHFRS